MSEQQVYIAKSRDAIKIGRSVNPEARVKDLATGNPEEIELKGTFDMSEREATAAKLEKKLHNLCQPWQKNGEWFELDAYHFILGYLCGISGDLAKFDEFVESL